MRDVRRALALVALAALGLLLVGVGGTQARWTSDGILPGTRLSTGRVDLRIDGQDAKSGLAALNATGLRPGDTTSTDVMLTNAGTTPLTYSAALSGSGPLASAPTFSLLASGCGASLPAGGLSLGVGQSRQVCLQLSLPATAPASLAASSARVGITLTAATDGWTDQAPITGIDLATVALTAPHLTCDRSVLTKVTVAWNAVPGATGYYFRSGPLGARVITPVVSQTLGGTLTDLTSTFTVQAAFGSTDWVSPESNAC